MFSKDCMVMERSRSWLELQEAGLRGKEKPTVTVHRRGETTLTVSGVDHTRSEHRASKLTKVFCFFLQPSLFVTERGEASFTQSPQDTCRVNRHKDHLKRLRKWSVIVSLGEDVFQCRPCHGTPDAESLCAARAFKSTYKVAENIYKNKRDFT